MRRLAPVGLLALLALAAPADARRPVVAYLDSGTTTLQLFDAETGTAVPAPPLPAGMNFSSRRVAVSHNGRFVVYSHGGRVHLVDRATNLEKRLVNLPAIGTGGFLTVTNDGDRIAHDAGGNPPTTVYDRSAAAVIAAADTKLDAFLRQPVFSGDGRYIVGTILDGCGANATGSDICLFELGVGGVALPEESGNDEHPCIDGDGSVVAVSVAVGGVFELFEHDFTAPGAALVRRTTSGGVGEDYCALDSAGGYIGYSDLNTDVAGLFDRATSTLVSLPASARNIAGLTDPYTPPAPTGPRKPVVAYLAGGGELRLWDSQLERNVTPPPLTVPDLGAGLRQWAISRGGRFVAWVDATQWGIHLFDRASASEVVLPGINQFTTFGDTTTRPGSLSVSDTGRIAFDANSNGPQRVYDSATGAFMSSGLLGDPDNDHKRGQLSGDGRFLASLCRREATPTRCAVDLGPDDDSVHVTDIATGLDTGFPENPAGLTDRDEAAPCIDGSGGHVGLNVSNSGFTDHDIHVYDRVASSWVAFPAGVNDRITDPSNDRNCRLDASGDWVGFEDANSDFLVYSRQGDGFLLLPAEVDAVGTPWLTGTYPPEPEPSAGGGPATGGDAGPGGGDAGAPAPSATPPVTTSALTLRLRARSPQRLARRRPAVVVHATCSLACSLNATATASVRGRAAVYRLTPVRGRRAAAGREVALRLRVPKKAAAAIRRALRRNPRARIPVTVTVTDPQRRVSARKRIRIRR